MNKIKVDKWKRHMITESADMKTYTIGNEKHYAQIEIHGSTDLGDTILTLLNDYVYFYIEDEEPILCPTCGQNTTHNSD